jgi:quercetin dioxygenase-like cupin family protein
VLRQGQRRVLDMDSGVRWEQLTPGADARVDALLVTYDPGGQSSSSGQLMTHAGVEYAYLIEGELTLELGFESHVLRAGDSLVFESSTPHLYRNLGSTPARGVWYVVDRSAAPATGVPGDPATPAERLTSAVQVLRALDSV